MAKIFRNESVSTLACYVLDRLSKEQVLSKLFLEESFLKYLRRVKMTGKIKIIITSFGFKEAILETLTRYRLLDLFDGIYTPSYFGYKDGVEHFEIFKGKNKMLDYALETYGLSDKSQILLLDDSIINVRYADKNRYPVILSDSDGLKGAHGKMILKYMRIAC